MGPKGEKGAKGELGEPGVMGEIGPKGEKGFMGEKGDLGDAGPPGPKGDPGPRGGKGDEGIQGERGIKGDQGIKGVKGSKGVVGPIGPKGTVGDKGQRGDKGEPGTGLPGPKGEKGSHGPVGDPGMKGRKGDTGLLGPPGQQGKPGLKSGGLTFVRWGRTVCPNTTGTELVYNGRAAGGHYRRSGGGANYLCLTEQPEYLNTNLALRNEAFLYGAATQAQSRQPNQPHDQSVPCAVCFTEARTTVLMIPGKYTCPTGWTREYYGYLMSEKYNHEKSTFECMDASPEAMSGGDYQRAGALFYNIGPSCASLPCPPYNQEEEITCVVCSK